MDTVTQTVELPARRQDRRHPLEWKRSVVEQTFEPGASVARVARDNNINANQVWAWCKLYAQGGFCMVSNDRLDELRLLPRLRVKLKLHVREDSHAVLNGARMS